MRLLNHSQIRKFILLETQRLRPGMRMRRVSKKALDAYEIRIASIIRGDILSHPTRGVTFRDTSIGVSR